MSKAQLKSHAHIDQKQVKVWLQTVGRTIKNAREKKSYSQDGLADTIGVSRGTVSALENGRSSAKLADLIRALLVLDLDIWSLLGGKTSSRPLRIEHRAVHELVDAIIAKESPADLQTTIDVLKHIAK